MKLKAFKTELKEILEFRGLFLQENNFQIRYNACHERNWSDSYLLTVDDVTVGYGSIKGKENLADRDAVFEFFILPAFRKMASLLFSELLLASKVPFIECQSNEPLLSSLLYTFAENIQSDAVLFSDSIITDYPNPGALFRPRQEEDILFEHQMEPVGEYVLEMQGGIVATGGYLLHYNIPFVDLYMEVCEDHRRKGLGCFLLQELKKECYRGGRVPAARCHIQNKASQATILKAGLKVCGFMLIGTVKPALQTVPWFDRS